ncbi:hypothetical protein BV20DRAFT_964499 [Pilatotrama ljubarskyi]|nr:hypothetical protein BV20DRAFT_964499 [Pilatotrama ljubarskyi]
MPSTDNAAADGVAKSMVSMLAGAGSRQPSTHPTPPSRWARVQQTGTATGQSRESIADAKERLPMPAATLRRTSTARVLHDHRP